MNDVVISPSSCFISNAALFFGTFLGPIFVILLFNIFVFAMVIRVLIKHSMKKLDHTKQQLDRKTAVKLLISLICVCFLFGLTWLFGALTVTGFADPMSSTVLHVDFVIINAFQGFFIFLFFCVFSSDARESWLEVFSCGCKSKFSHPSRPYHPSGRRNTLKLKIASFSMKRVSELPIKNDTDGNALSIDNIINMEERVSVVSITSIRESPEAREESPMN